MLSNIIEKCINIFSFYPTMSTRGRVTSDIWYHFTKAEGDGAKAKCRYCYSLISSSNGSTGNMKRHLKSKHPMVSYTRSDNTLTSDAAVTGAVQGVIDGNATIRSNDDGIDQEVEIQVPNLFSNNVSKPVSEIVNPDILLNTASKASGRSSFTPQALITKFVDINRPMPVHKSRSVDMQLLKMLCKEYHPFSLVEDPEFKKFLNMLCPSYVLPSRKTLTNSLLPVLYEEILSNVKEELRDASAVCLTSDGWTNINNISFYALTAHFVDRQGHLKCYLLECSEFSEKHTGDNISSWVTTVLQKFNIDYKITAIVTDNAANMKSAASNLKIRHVSCFAHSLNLVVQNAISRSIKPTVDKVKSVVQYFKKSSFALSKLSDMQKTMGKLLLKLKQDVPTRWNSTFEMLERIFINKEPVVSTLALLDS